MLRFKLCWTEIFFKSLGFKFSKVLIGFRMRGFSKPRISMVFWSLCKACLRFLSSAPLEWSFNDPKIPICLNTETGKNRLLFWKLTQLGTGLYGILTPIWYLTVGPKRDSTVLNKIISVVLFTYTVYQIGIACSVWRNKDEVPNGVNGILSYHQKLLKTPKLKTSISEITFFYKPETYFAFRKDWLKSQKNERSRASRWISLIKVDLTVRMFTLVIWCGLCELDLLPDIFAELQVPLLVSGVIRCLVLVMLALSIINVHFFFIPFYAVALRAYVGCLNIFIEALNCSTTEDKLPLLKGYRALCILHTRIAPFANPATGSLMYVGHTTSLFMFWLGIRGWELPFPNPAVNVIFPIPGIYFVLWLMATLALISHVSLKSEGLIQLFQERKWDPSFHFLIRRELKAMRPIRFQSGGCFVIGRESPGAFLTTMSNNLATLVLTF